MAIGKESIEQVKVVNWIRQCTTLPVIHVANERTCSPQYGALLKRMGVTPGVSDLFIPRAIKGYHGAWIELKTKTGKLSISQMDFLAKMNAEGYFAHCCYGSVDAIGVIANLYEIDLP